MSARKFSEPPDWQRARQSLASENDQAYYTSSLFDEEDDDLKAILDEKKLFAAQSTVKWSETRKMLWSSVVIPVEYLKHLDEKILENSSVENKPGITHAVVVLQHLLVALHRYLRSCGFRIQPCAYDSRQKSCRHYFGLWIRNRARIMDCQSRIVEVVSSTMFIGDGLHGIHEAYLHECMIHLYATVRRVVTTFPDRSEITLYHQFN